MAGGRVGVAGLSGGCRRVSTESQTRRLPVFVNYPGVMKGDGPVPKRRAVGLPARLWVLLVKW